MFFNVTLSRPAQSTVTFLYRTEDRTATSREDYKRQIAYLNIPVGRLATAILVPIMGDTKPEPDERFILKIINISGAILTKDSAVGKIINDDTQLTINLSIDKDDVREAVSEGTAVLILLNKVITERISLELAYSGTATPSDYSMTSGRNALGTRTVQIEPGASFAELILYAANDNLLESPDEYVKISITRVSVGKVINASDSVTILDNLGTDSDGDGLSNASELAIGTNPVNIDSDGDGINDFIEVQNPSNPLNTDKDGKINALDTDDDNDSILTINEDINKDKDPLNDDADSDGIPNYLDLDSDGDGIPDVTEGQQDVDFDLIPNFIDLDSDGDTFLDLIEGGGTDNNGDGLVDNPVDGNNNGWATEVDITEGGILLPLPDEDNNGIPNYLQPSAISGLVSPVHIYEGFSPNGDGKNDIWRIEGIAKFPENEVSIYNRWGQKVFGAIGYNNRSSAFGGTGTIASFSQKRLPDGIYFLLYQFGQNFQSRYRLLGYQALNLQTYQD